MADPAVLDIIADRRVDLNEEFTFLALDYTGSSFFMQVRPTRDTSGTPLLDLSTSGGNFSIFYAGTDTIANHISAGRLSEVPDGYTSGESLAISIVHLGIGFAAMSSLPFPEERGDDTILYYDIIRDPTSGSNEVVVRGKFIVRAGVTIP